MVDTGFNAAGIAPTMPVAFALMPGLRTTNRCIFVIGGVVGGYQFAYVAGYHAEIVIHNMLECCDALGDILLY